MIPSGKISPWGSTNSSPPLIGAALATFSTGGWKSGGSGGGSFERGGLGGESL